jgi:hypothetical protein
MRGLVQKDPARSESIQLPKVDGQIALFLSKKYRLAASEVEKYLHYAQLAAKEKNLDYTLVMAVMSIESNLNSITESPVGAQGLMQVMTSVHLDKLAVFGGASKVFDPESNIMVGATILADCIKLGGSVEMGLKCYVGATGPTDGGYGAKVLAEKERIEKARLGVFDFTANNKVLQDLGIWAAPPPATQQNGVIDAGVNSSSNPAQSGANNTPSASLTPVLTPLAAPPPLAAPAAPTGLLPAPQSVTLPVPAVSAAALQNSNLNPSSTNPVAPGKLK